MERYADVTVNSFREEGNRWIVGGKMDIRGMMNLNFTAILEKRWKIEFNVEMDCKLQTQLIKIVTSILGDVNLPLSRTVVVDTRV